MKKFILHITLFILPVLVGAVLLLFRPTPAKRAYHYLTDDCEGRGAWMYKRIFNWEEPIELAFLGSSHTINGINDTLINQLLSQQNARVQSTCNLGYCRLGRDLTYVLMKHLITQKKTKTFIVEVLPDEPPFSHPVFPFLADMEDVVSPQTLLNRSYANNLYTAAISRLMYMRQDLYQEPYPYKYGLRGTTGFSTNTFFADTNLLNTKQAEHYQNQHKSHTWTRRFNLPFPRAWLANIYTLAVQNNCKLIFLYIPPYGTPEKKPIEADTYARYGELWIPPDSIFSNKRNWYDEEHLNIYGARSLSTYLSGKIAGIQ